MSGFGFKAPRRLLQGVYKGAKKELVTKRPYEVSGFWPESACQASRVCGFCPSHNKARSALKRGKLRGVVNRAEQAKKTRKPKP